MGMSYKMLYFHGFLVIFRMFLDIFAPKARLPRVPVTSLQTLENKRVTYTISLFFKCVFRCLAPPQPTPPRLITGRQGPERHVSGVVGWGKDRYLTDRWHGLAGHTSIREGFSALKIEIFAFFGNSGVHERRIRAIDTRYGCPAPSPGINNRSRLLDYLFRHVA